ncbi:DUF3493 domain-containing protein [Synechococcus sp. CC9311]|uniref:DUF3493 domain-containing protein n=1 Tax=Synechococcus sp. (strain CC9311) TaxID=64471 RepID=UPI0008FF7072
MSDRDSQRQLDPALKDRLLQEARTPWRTLRRLLWLALFASGGLGLFVMTFRVTAGDTVVVSDLVIQISAVALFGSLLWFDRTREP